MVAARLFFNPAGIRRRNSEIAGDRPRTAHFEGSMKPTRTKLMGVTMRTASAAVIMLGAGFTDTAIAQPSADDGLQAFEIVRSVLQHPRCQNCHIPGDGPLQGDEGRPHDMNVKRGPVGRGAVAMECPVCHQQHNLPVSYGDNVPPGAPNWHLPPPQTRMVFINLSPHELCQNIKSPDFTGGKDLTAMMLHIRDDKLVAWGWAPGGQRSMPPATRAETVAAFKTWMDAGATCPQ
jgi:hypothetical protein